MAEVGVMAYPVVLASMYGFTKLGRGEGWGVYEWLRFGTLALLFGVVVSVQVTFVMAGALTSLIGLAGGVVSLLGAAGLLGLYLWERWVQAARSAPAVAAGPTA